MNENSGRGSLDGVPSDVAGLEKLRVPDNFSNEFMDCKAPFGFPQAASPPLSCVRSALLSSLIGMCVLC
ncbi:hypothetical protein GN958_ATG08018 [Phytophthora infestans]|uniref:Uncharacterized protein n=1 Tax=Phytophthora infestans TaxID=4787 RepID=A0A8S9UPY0_PHYIN|nr:hypothetical protein GN958_ATG08018 [Phytophthora infestans]